MVDRQVRPSDVTSFPIIEAMLWTPRERFAPAGQKEVAYADAPLAAVDEWTDFVREKAEGLLSNEVDSWMTGVNQNVEGKQVRILARYSGTAPDYRDWCDRVADGGYKDLELR